LHGIQGKDSLHGVGKMRPFEGPSGNISRLDINVRDLEHDLKDQPRPNLQEVRRSSSAVDSSRHIEVLARESSKIGENTKDDFQQLEELREAQERQESQMNDQENQLSMNDGVRQNMDKAGHDDHARSLDASKIVIEEGHGLAPNRNQSDQANSANMNNAGGSTGVVQFSPKK